MMPHDTFYNYINELETIFINNFPTIIIVDGIGAELKNYFCNVHFFNHFCEFFN